MVWLNFGCDSATNDLSPEFLERQRLAFPLSHIPLRVFECLFHVAEMLLGWLSCSGTATD